MSGCCQGFVNSLAKCFKRGIKRTNYDAGMVVASPVKTDEVAAVQGHENPLVRDGEGQDFGVGNGSTGVAALERG